MTLRPSLLNFLTYEENFLFFFNSVQGTGRKSKIGLRPLNMFCMFIEIYLSVVEALLKILLESVECNFINMFST
jgi:hypothetical protein